MVNNNVYFLRVKTSKPLNLKNQHQKVNFVKNVSAFITFWKRFYKCCQKLLFGCQKVLTVFWPFSDRHRTLTGDLVFSGLPSVALRSQQTQNFILSLPLPLPLPSLSLSLCPSHSIFWQFSARECSDIFVKRIVTESNQYCVLFLFFGQNLLIFILIFKKLIIFIQSQTSITIICCKWLDILRYSKSLEDFRSKDYF